MRPLTYVLGAFAGFFTFIGIGLIIKGFQVEGGITLVIGLLCLIQFIRFLKGEYDMEKKQNYVWYAGYGSNLNKQRFECYIIGGIPKYGNKPNPGCTEKTLPSENHLYLIPHRLYFALPNDKKKTENWCNGGVAFIEPNKEENKDHWTKGRIWKITKEQYEEVWKQEGKLWYDLPLDLGGRDGVPIKTITHNSKLSNVLRPSISYLKTIIVGLKETNNMNDNDIISYLIGKEGITNNYTKNELMEIIKSL